MKYESLTEADCHVLDTVYNQTVCPWCQCKNIRYTKRNSRLWSIWRIPNNNPRRFGGKNMGDESCYVYKTSLECIISCLVRLSLEISITCSLLTTTKDIPWLLLTSIFKIQPCIPPIYSHTRSLLLTDMCASNTLLIPQIITWRVVQGWLDLEI